MYVKYFGDVTDQCPTLKKTLYNVSRDHIQHKGLHSHLILPKGLKRTDSEIDQNFSLELATI